MNDTIIYFARTKAFLSILSGIGIGALIFGPVNFFLLKGFLFFISASFIYFGLKSVSGKPQLIISDEGLLPAGKLKKKIPWSSFEKVSIVKKKVDFRSMTFLQLTLKVKSNGPSNILIKELPLANLDHSPYEIEQLITEKWWNMESAAKKKALETVK